MQLGHKAKIIQVPVPTPTLYPHTTTNCYLIGNEYESLLVDAGYDRKETKVEIEKAIEQNHLARPEKIILTHSHRDHAPGVRQLSDWSPTVYCHKNEKRGIIEAISPISKISYIADEATLNIASLKLVVLHGPGHTSGQINIYIPSEQILLAGDNIVAEGTTWIGPPEGNMSEYIQTLNRLKRLKLTCIGPGHGQWIKNPYEQLEFVLKRRLQRENQIKSLLVNHEYLTATQLTEKIYENTIHPSVFYVAKKTIEAHLIKLINEGTVGQKDLNYFIVGS
ncbi:MBL fold metallo-hydrolase [Alkalihalobacterium elongatum]|uniref:MBL fold metallo-hydrolase n=1 Tax=Alkalihalobacterium elongatum TaxID=2675466 RepID=UPI001C1FAECB|nr:MBL fold metallo-hydrolase [Alkalihalobacterium elongatum]